MDEVIFRALNAGGPGWLDDAMLGVSWLFGPALVLPALVAIGAVVRVRRAILGRVVLAGAATGLLVQGIKHLVLRARPPAVLEGVRIVGDRLSTHAFPSGHTAAAFALAWIVFALDRRAGAAALAVALVVGASRVYLGAHWPTDVLAGATLASLVAWAAYLRPPRAPAESNP